MDHYETLGIGPNASDGVVLVAYRQRLKEAHPDTGTGDDAQLQAVKRAGEVLLSSAKRAEYDTALRTTHNDDNRSRRFGIGTPRLVAGVLGGLAAIAIIALAFSSDAARRRDYSVAFVEVSASDSWFDVVERVADCGDAATIQAAIDYLVAANPVLADAGFGDAQVVAFDPTRFDNAGCELTGRRTEAGNGDGQEDRADADVATAQEPPTPPAETEASSPDADAPGTGETSDDPQAPADEPRGSRSGPHLDDTNFVVAFHEDFVQEDSLDRFRWQIHHGIPFHGSPETWQGDHDENCGPPTTTRTINAPPEGFDRGEAAYWCAPGGPGTEHMMTSFRTKGYAQVAFSPDEVFDDLARVCWNQNMTDLGGRKWTQLVVVSETVFEANDERLDYVRPNLEDGPGSSGVFLSADEFMFVLQGGSTVTHTGRSIREEDFRGFTTEDKARRYRTCITDLENGTVRIELEREDTTEVRELRGAFPDGRVRVIFQDDTYNSTKRPAPVSEPFTWHWDDVLIETR